jgi:hypothetical protein
MEVAVFRRRERFCSAAGPSMSHGSPRKSCENWLFSVV